MLLAPGMYDLTCSSPGYQTATANDLQVIANKNKGYTFYLTQSKDSFKTATIGSGENQNEINVFPNPAKNLVHVSGEGLVKIQLINQTGQVVYENNQPESMTTINLSSIKPGIYFVKINSLSEVITKKLIVE
jgi:hypothetical protein